MSKHSAEGARSRWVGCLVVLGIIFLWAGAAAAQAPATIVRVEEDWELTLGEPDPDTDAPQVTCVVSPVGNLEAVHAVFQLNHYTLPDYTPGGLQLQVWNGDEPLGDRGLLDGVVSSQPGEVVRWTQSVRVHDGSLTFEVREGSSTTWGSFGGEGTLRISVPTTLTDLGAYSPDFSVQNSGVGYAGNRVQKLELKRVRAHLSNGDVIEDTTPRVVH